MSANRHRGEIAVMIGGRQHTLCLTLGALAELEAAFDAGHLSALMERLGSGQLGARHLAAIIGAGLRGGGHDISNDEAARLRFDGGPAAAVRIAVDLLAATFGHAASGGNSSRP